MVICNNNIRNIPSLKYLVEEYGSRAVLKDAWNEPYTFLELITPLVERFIEEYGESDIPQALLDMIEIWDTGALEEHLDANYEIIMKTGLKMNKDFEPEYEKLIGTCNGVDVCLCLLIALFCRPIGLEVCAKDLLDILPHMQERALVTGEAGADKDERKACGFSGFELCDEELRYCGRAVRRLRSLAANDEYVAYVSRGEVVICRGKEQVRCVKSADVGDIALFGEGDLLYAARPYKQGVLNLRSFTDEDIEDEAVVALSACGYQYAVLLHDASVQSNIPFDSEALQDVRLVDISVSHNLVLGITDDNRVFSSDEGILPEYTDAAKAVGSDGRIAVLTLQGDVYLNNSGKKAIGNGTVTDIAFCAKGLVVLDSCGISLIEDGGRCRMLVEGAVREMAVSKGHVIYKMKESATIITI